MEFVNSLYNPGSSTSVLVDVICKAIRARICFAVSLFYRLFYVGELSYWLDLSQRIWLFNLKPFIIASVHIFSVFDLKLLQWAFPVLSNCPVSKMSTSVVWFANVGALFNFVTIYSWWLPLFPGSKICMSGIWSLNAEALAVVPWQTRIPEMSSSEPRNMNVLTVAPFRLVKSPCWIQRKHNNCFISYWRFTIPSPATVRPGHN